MNTRLQGNMEVRTDGQGTSADKRERAMRGRATAMLTLKEAAAYLGYSPSYFRKLTMRRAVPMYKPGKSCYFREEDLDAYIASHRVAPRGERGKP